MPGPIDPSGLDGPGVRSADAAWRRSQLAASAQGG